ncbi:unnamed protein product [Symbiodinium sp. CCMP2592]|nr:unnamed protein product [Symbiodinium sp. CCMP2592]
MGVYQCLLGIARDFGPSPDNVNAAVDAVVKAAATVKRGMREKDGQSGAQDVVDKELHHHLKDSPGPMRNQRQGFVRPQVGGKRMSRCSASWGLDWQRLRDLWLACEVSGLPIDRGSCPMASKDLQSRFRLQLSCTFMSG